MTFSILMESGGAATPLLPGEKAPEAPPPTHSLSTKASSPKPAFVSSSRGAELKAKEKGLRAGAPTGKTVGEFALKGVEAVIEGAGETRPDEALAKAAGEFAAEKVCRDPVKAICADYRAAEGSLDEEICTTVGEMLMGGLIDSTDFEIGEVPAHYLGPHLTKFLEGFTPGCLAKTVLGESYEFAKARDEESGLSDALSGEKAKPLRMASRPDMEYIPDETSDEDCKPSTYRPGFEECKLR